MLFRTMRKVKSFVKKINQLKCIEAVRKMLLTTAAPSGKVNYMGTASYQSLKL